MQLLLIYAVPGCWVHPDSGSHTRLIAQTAPGPLTIITRGVGVRNEEVGVQS